MWPKLASVSAHRTTAVLCADTEGGTATTVAMARRAVLGLLAAALVACSEDPVTRDTSCYAIPSGTAAARSFHNGLDVAKGIIEMKICNGTNQPCSVVA